MKDQNKTKKQLVNELIELRQRTTELEKLEPDHKGMEEALRASILRFRRLFETAKDGILILNNHGVRLAKLQLLEEKN